MKVTVQHYVRAHVREIVAAMSEEWEFESDTFPKMDQPLPDELSALGTSSLCGGESEEEFAERLSQAVWKANQGYCHVEVQATYLDVDPPSTIHSPSMDDYRQWKETAA